jgi:hypothetical protein
VVCAATRTSAIAVLEETDGESLQHVVEVAHNLPSVGYCGRVEALAAEVPPPEDAALARARATLAMALWPARPDDSARARRARELMATAERWYRDAGEGYERRLAELARWRREHSMEP